MKRTIVFGLFLLVAVAGWRIGGTLNSDAISMAIGVIFGVLAGIPTALLVLAGERRRAEAERSVGPSRAGGSGYPYPYHQPPPVIVVTGAPTQPQAQSFGPQGQLMPPVETPGTTQRRYKVVGETEEWIDEW
ncbi:hypothetical protein FKZ61_014735 [Litorilinea aerophila]|uniref:Uncharacterized protein n=1 Tax=Litorilinea aerophila TaxID=1204385 RepID=A0A540VDL1_9CHLR|nr:hypothetical protein [Litorilinea aerophila]MCC9077360.1 hypothetical protein [Litorilinea aerophila]